MRNSLIQYLPTIALSVALIGATTATRAQDKPAPAPSYVTQTTVRFVMPEGGSGKEFVDMYKEYFDKVIAKNPMIKHYSILRHAWGSVGGSFVIVAEYASWADIEKAGDETEKLVEAAWPDKAAREAFFTKLASYQDMYHSDEIYTVQDPFTK